MVFVAIAPSVLPSRVLVRVRAVVVGLGGACVRESLSVMIIFVRFIWLKAKRCRLSYTVLAMVFVIILSLSLRVVLMMNRTFKRFARLAIRSKLSKSHKGGGGCQNLRLTQWTRPLKVDFCVAINEMKKPNRVMIILG